MTEVAKAFSYNKNFILRGLSSPAPFAVFMCKILILLNNFFETNWPIFTKFHVDPSVEMGLRVCSDVMLQ